MEHVAIMKKSWGMIPKIISGEKIIESRWYKNKAAPWGKINPNDTVYFKNGGEPVSLKARVIKVIQYENLNQEKIGLILEEFAGRLVIGDKGSFQVVVKDKKYGILVFVDHPEKIKPWEIDKTGFGAMAAWICVQDVKKIKIPGF